MTENRPQSVTVTTFGQYKLLVESIGALITVSAAAAACGVCRERIYTLLEAERFTRFVVFGQIELSWHEVEAWATSESRACRNGARPHPVNYLPEAKRAS